jgi:hypothetical protein
MNLIITEHDYEVSLDKAQVKKLKPDLDSRTGFRHREWQKCWRLIKPGR